MRRRSWPWALAALLLLVTMAGTAHPCGQAVTVGHAIVSAAGAPTPLAGPQADCHCVCHATWIPARPTSCCTFGPLSRVEIPAPANPEGFFLAGFGEPPRLA